MEPVKHPHWLNLNTKQIHALDKQKRDEEQQSSSQIQAALCNLEQQLLQCVQSLHSAEQHLQMGGMQCTTPFVQDIQHYISGLKSIGEMSPALDDISFPISLCDYIDQGKSPDMQMKQNYHITRARNDMQRGRIADTFTLEQYLRDGQQYFTNPSKKKAKAINAEKPAHTHNGHHSATHSHPNNNNNNAGEVADIHMKDST